jgi:hypothetical protein
VKNRKDWTIRCCWLTRCVGRIDRQSSERNRVEQTGCAMNSTSVSLWSPDELLPTRYCSARGTPSTSTNVAERVDGLGVKRCPRCSLLYVDPVPSEAALARCYGPNYYSSGTGLVGYASPDAASHHEARRTELTTGGPLGFREITRVCRNCRVPRTILEICTA